MLKIIDKNFTRSNNDNLTDTSLRKSLHQYNLMQNKYAFDRVGE